MHELFLRRSTSHEQRPPHRKEPEDDQVRLVLKVGKRRMRVEVSDKGTGFKRAVTPATPDQQSGWGLQIVEKLTDRWGVELADESGSTVWFEIDS